MRGFISSDGTAEISASGTTDDPKHTVGHGEAGTPYSHPMRGSFAAGQGRATRVGVTPCSASLIKQR